MTLPSFGFRRGPALARRYPLVWQARDLSLNAQTGQVGTLVRALTAAANDSAGVSRTLNYHQPRWTYENAVGLRLGGASGGVTEYLTWDLPILPVTMSGLFDFTEFGTAANAGGASLGSLGTNSTTSPKAYWTSNASGQYAVTHDPTGSAAVVSTAGVTPTTGQRCRFRWWIYSDGAVQSWMSINGGAETAGSKSAAKTFGAAWAGTPTLWINTIGTTFTYGHTILHGVVVALGNQTQANLLEALT